jgi:ABC-2 type transport system permease protein
MSASQRISFWLIGSLADKLKCSNAEMLKTIRRTFSIYTAFAAMVPKMFLAYSIWVWMQFIVQIIALVIFVAFWTAVYAEQNTLGGLSLNQTLNYIILAQIFLPAATSTGTIYYFGDLMREGKIGIELLRPLDFQGATYAFAISQIGVSMVTQLPLAIVAWLLFRFQIPTNPLIWLAFLITLLLGTGILFFFDWMLGCISFYSTETWGLSVLRFGFAAFFSGSLVPLTMMPEWLERITAVLPFAQALYMPVSILGGITPLSDVPRIWFVQIIYLIMLGIMSRIVFRVAVRKVTVQGG